jgi:hypothetical protein
MFPHIFSSWQYNIKETEEGRFPFVRFTFREHIHWTRDITQSKQPFIFGDANRKKSKIAVSCGWICWSSHQYEVKAWACPVEQEWYHFVLNA